MNNLNYVDYIYENKILIRCDNCKNKNLLSDLKAKRKIFSKNLWVIKYRNQNDLAKKLQIFNDNNFMFAGSTSGWNPADIYISMRGQNKVTGKVIEISWTSPNKIITRTL